MIIDWPEAWGCNNGLLEILHGVLLLWPPHEFHVLICQDNQGFGTFYKILDPNPDHAAYTQETMDLSKRCTVWPVQNILNLLVFRVATLVGTLVAHSNHFWHAEIHLHPENI